jgi:amino-acid N-acetyltransferase
MPDPLMIRGRPPRSTAVALLQSQGLPVSDITDEHLEHFFFAASEGAPIGLVGLEIYGNDALLRSLVIGETARGRGLGSALTYHAEHYAASKSVRSIYLLTTTAEAFFQRLGYERIDRSQAPPSIERTREFASLCPASSVFMVKSLWPGCCAT